MTSARASTGVIFVVNDTRDRVDSSVGNGECRTSAGTCTLRAAVQEASALAGATIHVPGGVYEIEVPVINLDTPTSGDFDIAAPVKILGAGAGSTIVDGGFPVQASEFARGLDRLFEIHPTARDVTISGLTLREGFSDDGGGAIQNWSSGLLRLENVRVLDSYASKAGGGVNNGDPAEYEWGTDPLHFPPSGRIEIVDSIFSGNATGGSGAAVNNSSSGTVSITNSRVVDNPGLMIPDPLDPESMIPAAGVYDPGASAITNEGFGDSVGTIRIADSTVSGNYATHTGGGVLNGGSGALVVERSKITDNTSEAGGGGIYSSGGTLTVSSSTITGNLAADGGGIYSAGSVDSVGLRPRFTLTNSTVSGNTAHASAGGVSSGGDAHVTITDVVFENNHAGDDAGGLLNDGRAGLELTRATFSGNQVGNEGGGALTATERLVTIRDSIFSGNAAGVPEVDEGVINVNDAGGGGLLTESGPVTVTRSTFTNNSASAEGGGIRMDNLADVTIADSEVRSNHAGTDGGGIENSAARVTFERLHIVDNRAEGDGGGIKNSSSGEFTILETTVERNSGMDGGGLANAPDNDLVVRSSLFLANTARAPKLVEGEMEDAGLGGGIFSLADGDSLIENSTISGNTAAVGGGGLFHDADGELKLINNTIWRNSAPRGGGVGVAESDFVPEVPPKANIAVIARNTIIGGSRKGGSCDWYISSEGGNLDGGGIQDSTPDSEGAILPAQTACFLGTTPNSDSALPAGGDRRSTTFAPDAIADNGGPTLTHALNWGSVAVDGGVGSCAEVDQRGVTRPQNGKCDMGAFEFVGPPPPVDNVAPDTEYLSGPIQDSLETMAFRFTGSDTAGTTSDGTTAPGTALEDLNFECRFLEHDPAEPPEILAPWDPIPPELWWNSCSSPWQVPLAEEGMFTFEVRAIDRAGNIDPTPAVKHIGGADTSPPQTIIAEKPPLVTGSRSATFTFSGIDNQTPPQFLEFECRLDTRDPDLWLECVNPALFSNLTSGSHMLEVRAIDGADNIDPTPARYTWTVGQPVTSGGTVNCDLANITLTAAADAWVDEVNPLENYLFETELTVRSGSTGDPAAGEPVVGQNARTLVRFALPNDAPGCTLEEATLRLYSDSSVTGRSLEADPLAGPWLESTLTWFNQPASMGAPVTTASGEGYREWNVLAHVEGMLESGVNHGWLIRDAFESDPDGEDLSFLSRETPQDPPPATLPVLVLRYAADTALAPEPPTPATEPTEVYCGQVVVVSTLVANDLTGCLGEGLVIGAPNIVLDLNGHTVESGFAHVAGQEEGIPAGIRNGGHKNVVIRNGTVRGFGYGALLTSGTTHNVVEELQLEENVLAGVELFDADDGRNGNVIRNNVLTGNGEAGVSIVSDSENSVFTGNVLESNGGVGFHLVDSRGHRIENNVVDGVSRSLLVDSDAGAHLEGSTDNVLIDNRMSDAGDAGIILAAGSHRNRIEGNELVRNGDAGVSIGDSDGTKVIENLAHGSSDGGVVVGNGNGTVVRGNDLRFNPNGVAASNSNNLVIEDNNASDSQQTGLEIGNGVGIRIVNNVANRTGGSGISMEGAAFDALGNPVGGALIQGNTANENLESGIAVAAGGHTIADNDAYNNAGFGITAEGNVDGGTTAATMNRASGNGEPEQCIGVVCVTGEAPPVTPPDTTPPDTAIDATPADPTFSTSATFRFSAEDGPGGTPVTAMVYECRLDPPPDPPLPPVEPEPPEPPEPGQQPDVDPVDPTNPDTWGECVSPMHYSSLEPGEHHFEVRAIDHAGNVDFTAASYDWTIDPTVEGTDGPDAIAPSTQIFSGPASPTISTTATFRFSGSDNMTPGLSLRYECRLDSTAAAGWEDCAYPQQVYSNLGEGLHTFEVRAMDQHHNRDPSPATHTWEVELPPADTTAPETSVEAGPDRVTVYTHATFTFSSGEPEATFECSLDGAAFEACSSPKEYTGLPVGFREFRVRARDAAGNVDPTPAAYPWTIGPAPVPTTVFCGQVITRSIVLRNDLNDCLYDGLVVGAPNITIDLDGHLIDGKGLGAGIRIDGHDYVTLRNGRIEDFDYGAMLNTGTEGAIVETLTLERNQEAGIGLGHVPPPLDPAIPPPSEPPPSFQSGVVRNILRHNSIVANDLGIWLTNGARDNSIFANSLGANAKEGIWVERSTANRIEANQIIGTSGPAVDLKGSNGNTVANNVLTENGGGVFIGITETGGIVGLPSDDNRVEGNTIAESGNDAIEVIHSEGNQLIDNVASQSNGDGVRLYYANNTLVRGNDVRNNKGGITLMNSSDNRLEANDAGNSEGAGISLADLSQSNEVVGNTSSNNDGAGIYVGDEVGAGAGTLIENNRTHNNISYGIHVPKVSHTIKDNIANDNGTWGIYASEGSNGRVNVDGGGNRAMGNLGPIDSFTLQPLQCYTIRCEGGSAPSEQIPPDTMLIEGPPNPSTNDVATFDFTGSDNASSVTFECKLDGGAFAACVSPKIYGVALGAHTFAVRAVDVAGNVDESPATHAWTVIESPTGAPETTIDSGPDPTTVQTGATFDFSSSKRGSTYQCSLDGAAFAGCTSPKTYTGLTVGAHEFRVRATESGNTDATPAAYSWTVAAAPVPAEVGCGEIIVRSTLVRNDLIDCPGNALIVGAHGITIDLDGHLIDGLGLDAGVLNNGYDSVTITNGTIQQFAYGVQLNPGSSLNVLSSLRPMFNEEAGILLSDADQNGKGNTLRDNTLVSNVAGIWLASNTRHTLIRDNALGANTADGLRLEFASENRIEANEIRGSGGIGILMAGGGDNTVVGNTVSASGGYGISVGAELLPSNGNRVERNTIEEGAGGIIVDDSTGTDILFNVVTGTTGPGVSMSLSHDNLVRGNDLSGNAGGIELSESNGNRVEANNASGTLGAGIALDLSFNNVVVDNAATGNGGEGIEIGESAPTGAGNRVERNTADANGGDGILVAGAGHTLTANTARLNGGWGIYAPVGVTDGGGNFAAGNMEPDQCYGVVCTLGTVPGAPETWIVEKPPNPSSSRNASFTYMGSDDITPLRELVFECRLDNTNPLAWEDCEYPAEYLNLSPGQHTFEVRAVDQLGAGLADPTPARYTWVYEPLPAGVAPNVVIDLKPELETSLFEALFTFHSNEPDVTFECKVDLFPYEPCGFAEPASYMSMGAFEWGFAETEVGLHRFSVRAIDFEGNVGVPATHTWSILGVVTTFTAGPGFTPGETPFDPPQGGEVQETTATLDFIANVADATYECSLDLAPFVPCTPPVTYTGLIPGSHMLRVVATDLATGMTELEAAEYEWSIVDAVDVAPPETTIERAPATGSSSTIFEFAGTDDMTPPALLTYECRVDSTNELDWFQCTSPFNLLDLYTYADFQMAPGQHTFEVRAIDIAEPAFENPASPTPNAEGNVDPSPATYTWTMVADTSPPGTGILAGPPAKIGPATEALLEFVASDNATPATQLAFECSLNGAAFEPCNSPHSVQGLEPGSYTFRVRAVDLAGNVDATPATRTWTVVPAPVTTITSGPTPSAGQLTVGSESAIFTFTADQAGSTFECALDGAEFAPCTSPQAYWIVDNGTHVLEIRATNPEGVVEEPSARYEWTVELGPDTTPPNTTITSGPRKPADPSTVATFTFTGSDNRTPASFLTFECALDGTAYNSCVSPQQFSDLTQGGHVMLIRARDAAGNFDTTPARYEWTVTAPPLTTILSGPDEITENTNATFTFVSDVPGSTFQCWLDGLMEPCTSPKSYTGLAAGDHLFAVLATAPGGITGLQWEEYEWTIGDSTAPITVIQSGPDIQSESTSADFVFTSEPGVTFLCSLDGSEPRPCTSPVAYPRLHPGAHRFEVMAVGPTQFDANGLPVAPLYDPIPAVYEWTIVDLEPPDTALEYGPPATTASMNAYFGFTSDDPTAIIQCNLDGAGFSECDVPTVFEGLLPGTHTLVARAVDLAGNIDPSPVSHTWTIAASGPTNTPVGTNVTVELPMPDGPGTATVTFLEVTIPGVTTIGSLTGGPALPPGYRLAGGRYYDISTTADGEPTSLCIPYDPASFAGGAARLLQYDGALWLDVTTLSDPSAARVCGLPEAFSLFALASASSAAPLASITSGPPAVSNSGTATFTFFSDQPDTMFQCSIDGLPFTGCTSPVTYTHLEEGGHTFQVQAIGADGQMQVVPSLYEWEIILGPDTVPPDTRITKAPPALTVNFISMFEFTGSDNQTHELELDFECSLDGGPYEQCDVPHDVQVFAAGQHTLAVRAVDLALNVDPTPATHTWTIVDLSAPDTTIDLGPPGETESTSAIFEFSGYEELSELPVTEFECSLDNAEFVDCTSPHEVHGLSAGPHVFQVRARDLAGVVDPTPDFYEWLVISTVDTTPPDTTIVSAPPAISGPDVMFAFASNELLAEFECSLDGAAFQGCEPLYELQGLASGAHTLLVRALDLAEIPNVDATPASYTWTVVGEPETTILSGPDDPSATLSATFTFTSDQPDATFECSVDGSAYVPCSSGFLAGPLTQDTHHFEVRARNEFRYLDGTQVVDRSPATYEWTIQDVEPPDTTITTVTTLGPTDLVEPNSLKFEFAGTDNGTAAWELDFECALDGEPFAGCSTPHYLPLAELQGGNHVFRVRAVDALGNEDPTPAEHAFTTEGAPETTILSGPDVQTESTEATFSFSSDQAGATFECSLDLAPFAACPSPVTFTNVPWGEHQLEVRAKAPFGTVDLTPDVYTWESGDMTPPTVTITSGPALATTSRDATFTFSADDPDALFQCSLDGLPSPPAFCTSGKTYTELAAGEHVFEVEATKPNLLVEGVAASWTWTIEDNTAPETTIESAPAAEIALETPAVFTFSSNEPDASFECALDPAGVPQYSPCASPPANSAEFTGLAAGEHTLLVRAVDPSLNVDASPASHTWTVVGPPVTTISGPDNPSTSSSASFTFAADQPGATFQCSLDGALFAACTSPLEYTGLEAGVHELEVQATNGFALVEEPPARYVWTIELPPDTTAPETTIDFGPPATTQNTTATFAFSANELEVTFECSLDGGAFEGCDSPHQVQDLMLGSHTLEVRATDATGNVDATPAGYSWTVEAPPPPNTETGADVTVVVSTSDGSTTATVTFASVTAEGLTAVANLEGAPALPDGYLQAGAVYYDVSTTAQYTAPVTVCLTYDPASIADPVRLLHYEGGNWIDVTTSSDPGAGRVCGVVDGLSAFAIATGSAAVVPETTIESGPPASTVSTSADFAFSSDDPFATFECSLDDALDWGSCEATTTFSGLLAGPHVLLVRAKNAAGVYDATPARHEWTITPLPETTILTGPDDPTESTTATFTFTSDQPGATFECLLDDATFYSPCESGITYTSLSLDAHDFHVRAVDAAGNVDPTPAEYSWDIGDIPPLVTIESGPDATTESRAATFVFSAAEPGLVYECSLDGAAYAACTSPKTYSGVPFGNHTFQVRVFSPTAVVEPPVTSYAWTVADLTVPDTVIDSGPPAVTDGHDAIVDFHATEPNATFECSLNGEPFAPCSPPASYSGQLPGDYTFRVRATDLAGNVDSTPATRSWTVVTPPEATIDSGPDPDVPTAATEATFTFSSNTAGATFECALDNELGPFVVCTSPHLVQGLADGDHVLFVRAVHPLGVASESPAEWSWTVDSGPPVATIVSGPDATTTSRTATFAFSGNEAGVVFECALDDVTFADPQTGEPLECLSPFGLADLSVGEHTFRVRAIDEALNAGPWASHTWTIVDNTAPETTILATPPATTTSTSASFTFSAGEAGSTLECSLDGAAFATCTSPKEYTGIAVGGHTFEVRATDAAGNIDQTPASYTWTIEPPADTVAPETEITSPPPAPVGDTVNFRFTGSDAVTPELLLRFECRLDSQDAAGWAACTSPRAYADLAVGSHIFDVRAIDEAGNVDPTPASYAWTVLANDTTPPETTIDSAPADTTADTTATFTFSASEPGSTFTCSLDSAASVPCGSPLEYTGLAVGEHTFLVRATDAAGNVDGTAAVHEWTVEPPPDTSPPDTQITDVATGSVIISFAGSDNLTPPELLNFECRLAGEQFAACVSPMAYPDQDGSYTFEVRAIDLAGNPDPTPATHSWTVDRTAPETTITASPAVPTTSTSATFSFAASESGSTFECSLDAAAFVACTSPRQYTGLATGSHQFRVVAKDAAGNVDASPATFSWTIGSACAGSTQTLGANADSWILQSSSSSNYGQDSVIKVDTKSGANARSLVRFALPAIPSGCQVVSAKLRLYASSYKTPRTLHALQLAAAWTEGGVTWTNQPATTGPAAAVASGSGYREWTVTAQVQSMYSSANNGFLIRDSVENGVGIEQGFHSREKGTDNPPRLVITFG